MINKEEFEQKIVPLLSRFQKELSDEAIFSLAVNLDQNAEPWLGAVIFGKKHLAKGRFDGSEFVCYETRRITDARWSSFGGGAVCEILYDGEWLELCRAFSSEKANVSQLARIVKEVAGGVLRPEDAGFVYRTTVCPICRRPLTRKGMVICNVCAGRKKFGTLLFSMIRPQLGWIGLTFLLFFVTSILNLLLPSIQATLVDDYLTCPDPEAVLASFSSVIWVILSMVLVRLGITTASVLRNIVLAKVSNHTTVMLRHMVYEKIQSLSVAGISNHSAGDLISRVSRDAQVISTFLNSQAPNILEQSFTILLVGAMIFAKSWLLGLMIFVPVPLVLLIFRLIWKRNHRYYSRQWVENSASNTILHDTFKGVRVVKVFGTEKNEIEKYDRAILAQRNTAYRNEKAWARVVPFAEFLLQLGSFFLLYFVGSKILQGEMTIGELTMYSAYVSLIYAPLRWMANIPSILQHVSTSTARMFEVLDEEPDVADKEDPVEIRIRGEVEIDHIWFGYDENENTLEDVSVTVGPGEMLGIVGKSGVGKSTLINLIMRLYDVRRGAIRIDGVDVRDLSQRCLRSQIGVVLQESFLFHGTVYENIAYAKPEASREEVMAAARLANAHSFIMKLPDGYNTMVGEKGHTLSGGERQRISIARAILHDPKILILDEATSALDTETEKMVQEALQRLCQNRTTIAIAHRLSTLRNATKLLVLDQKTVAEVGTHEELVQKEGGIYQGLVLAQREMSRVKKSETDVNAG